MRIKFALFQQRSIIHQSLYSQFALKKRSETAQLTVIRNINF